MEKREQVYQTAFTIGKRHFANPITNEIGILEGGKATVLQRMEPKVMAVLTLLAQHAGQVVLKPTLTAAIWNDYGGAEDSLMQAISKLRKVLGDQAKHPTFIETISKKGYRLIPAVHPLEEWPEKDAAAPRTYVYRQVGSFTDFIEKLTQPKFLLAFLLFAVCILMALAILSYTVFWSNWL